MNCNSVLSEHTPVALFQTNLTLGWANFPKRPSHLIDDPLATAVGRTSVGGPEHQGARARACVCLCASKWASENQEEQPGPQR